MKTILILLDTFRKDHFSIYNPDTDVKTPNLDLLASNSFVFENHCTGSLPCMPARRDIQTGRLDFFDKFWGGLEPFDITMAGELTMNNIKTHIETDHHHYFSVGGEGYVQSYKTWNFNRGQQNDPWISQVDNYQMPTNIHGRYNNQYELNKTKFINMEDFPTIKTFNGACEFVRLNQDCEDFFLHVEGFDPHEPFEAPKEFLEMYGITKDELEEFYNSPKYGICDDNELQNDYIRRKYKANMSFADYGVGLLIKQLKELNIYDECNIIFTSDHGFHLGEHNFLGKGVTHVYNEVCNIPLLFKIKNQKEQVRYSGLTQNIDLFPTVMDLYNLEVPNKVHGKSLVPIFNGVKAPIHDEILSGYFGQSVMYRNDKYTLYKAPASDDCYPLNLYTAMPTMFQGALGGKYGMIKFDHTKIEMGRYLNHTKYPVFKYPFAHKGKKSPLSGAIFQTKVFENSDIKQEKNIVDESILLDLENKLFYAMKQLDVVEESYERLGLKS